MTPSEAIRRCVDAIGRGTKGPASTTASRLGVTRSAVSRMLSGLDKPSADIAIRMAEMARAAGEEVWLHELRPDIYPLGIEGIIYQRTPEPLRVPLGGRKRKGGEG